MYKYLGLILYVFTASPISIMAGEAFAVMPMLFVYIAINLAYNYHEHASCLLSVYKHYKGL